MDDISEEYLFPYAQGSQTDEKVQRAHKDMYTFDCSHAGFSTFPWGRNMPHFQKSLRMPRVAVWSRYGYLRLAEKAVLDLKSSYPAGSKLKESFQASGDTMVPNYIGFRAR